MPIVRECQTEQLKAIVLDTQINIFPNPSEGFVPLQPQVKAF